MTRAKYHTADILLRLLKSRQRPAAGQAGSANLHEHVPIPAKQREVRFSDFESVARLKERGGLAKDNQENWCRLWQQNPALAVAKSQPSMGWVLETAQGIVGYQGNVPLLYQFGGRTLVAATAAGLVVEPAYRARCIVLLASFYRQRDVDLFVINAHDRIRGQPIKGPSRKGFGSARLRQGAFLGPGCSPVFEIARSEVRHGERNGSGWDLPRLVGLASGYPSPRTPGPPYE